VEEWVGLLAGFPFAMTYHRVPRTPPIRTKAKHGFLSRRFGTALARKNRGQFEPELVATLPSWIIMMVKQDELEMTSYKSRPLRSSRELVEGLDQYVAEARLALTNTTDEHLLEPLAAAGCRPGGGGTGPPHHASGRRLQSPGAPLRTADRLSAADGAPVPALYGPSADEGRP